ncbi:5094_t:CDS:2 [Entrophospora sp. SA101]|nr:5094_t:CDS:2 [Entrophospora sp. SA101]
MTSKTFIVTGASRGIGRSATLFMVKNFQNNILAISRSKDDLANLKQHVEVDLNLKDKLEIVVGDVAEEAIIDEAINKCLNKWKRIDGVVSNAGVIEPLGKIFDTNLEDWKRCFDVNFFSNVLLIQKILPHLRDTIKNGGNGGNIIFTSSGAAVKACYGWGAYCSSKTALNMLVKTLSIEEDIITSIAIRPGVVNTAMQKFIREKGDNTMSKNDHENYIKLYEDNELLSPDEPGYVISSLINGNKNEIHKFSGRFISWNDEALNNFNNK